MIIKYDGTPDYDVKIHCPNCDTDIYIYVEEFSDFGYKGVQCKGCGKNITFTLDISASFVKMEDEK